MRIFIFLLVTCFTGQLTAQNFNLIINNGYGSGNYVEGDSIHVWSARANSAEVFTHWSGDGAKYLIRPTEWHTQMIVPPGTGQSDYTLIANYDLIGVFQTGEYTLQQWGENNEDGNFFPTDKTINYAFAQNPKAIVFLIHGTGGNSNSWFTRYERQSLLKDLLYNGYAVFALNSNETTLGDQNNDQKIRWQNSMMKQDTTSNVDFKNVLATRDFIFNSPQLDFEELPVFLIGGSNGANFADYCTAALDFKASAHMTGNGLRTLFRAEQDSIPLKPIIWIQAINDNNASADSTVARDNYRALMDRGLATEWYWQERSPAYPQRFRRSLNGINLPLSNALFDSLSSQGYLDSDNYLNILDINGDFPFDDFYSNFNLTNDQKGDFRDQLNAINADHGASGDYNKAIIDFFDQCLLVSADYGLTTINTDQLLLYPNPVKHKIYLKSEIPFESLFIYDISGQLVLEGNAKEVDVSFLPSGYYIVKYNQSFTRSFIKI